MPTKKYFHGDISFINIKFGKLTVTSPLIIEKRNNRKDAYVEVFCECGTNKLVLLTSLVRRRTVSCGCFMRQRQKEANITHGHTINRNKSRCYKIWGDMIKRCTNKKCKSYLDYGGRGITVCDRWLNSFQNFLEDMGEPEGNHSIDRENNELGYYKENCRWTDRKTQNRNSRHNHTIEYQGETFCLSEWSEKLGIPITTLSSRILRGWPIEQAFTIPKLRQGQGNLRIKNKK